jgi:hypothetical protein
MAYHSRTCSQFNGYYCHKCGGTYHGDYCCPTCPAPFWITELARREAMSSGHTILQCCYFDRCGNEEEFPNEHVPPSYCCDECFALVNARSGE